MNRETIKKLAVRSAIALIPVGYVTACSYESHRGEAAMAQVRKGDSEEKVVALFGPLIHVSIKAWGIVGTLATRVSTHV